MNYGATLGKIYRSLFFRGVVWNVDESLEKKRLQWQTFTVISSRYKWLQKAKCCSYCSYLNYRHGWITEWADR